MNNCCTATLAGGLQTNVLTAESLPELAQALNAYGRNVLWVLDENTARLVRPLPQNHVILEAGEVAKNWQGIERILKTAIDEGLSRDSRFIAIGGGVICDMTAFAASLFMRGCQLTLVPTTLLCMVDASLGGKTAIDFMGGKNLVGTFYPAQEVLICTDILKTLPEKEYLNGLAEVIKHALLSPDDALQQMLVSESKAILSRDKDTLSKLVSLSLDVKKWYIERDPCETHGIRSALNLGHTFGHALESIGMFSSWSHGAAVAWGTARALEAGTLLGITDPQYAASAVRLFTMYGYDLDHRIGRGDWIQYKQALAKDKKKTAGSVKFVLLESQGKPILTPLDPAVVQKLVIRGPI